MYFFWLEKYDINATEMEVREYTHTGMNDNRVLTACTG